MTEAVGSFNNRLESKINDRTSSACTFKDRSDRLTHDQRQSESTNIQHRQHDDHLLTRSLIPPSATLSSISSTRSPPAVALPAASRAVTVTVCACPAVSCGGSAPTAECAAWPTSGFTSSAHGDPAVHVCWRQQAASDVMVAPSGWSALAGTVHALQDKVGHLPGRQLPCSKAGQCGAVAKTLERGPVPQALRRSSSTLDVGAGVGDGQVAGAGQAGREGARQLVAVPAGGLPAHLHRLLCQ